MENATKALLIASAVLVAIVLIALGTLLVKNAANTGKQADDTGKIISDATDAAIRSYQKIYIKADEFNEFIKDMGSKYTSANELVSAIGIQNTKLRNQIEVIGYAYQGTPNSWGRDPEAEYRLKPDAPDFSDEWIEYQNYMCNTFCTKLEAVGKLKKVNNPSDMNNIKQALFEVYKEQRDETATMETFKSKAGMSILFRFGLDNEGYINKMVLIGRISRW